MKKFTLYDLEKRVNARAKAPAGESYTRALLDKVKDAAGKAAEQAKHATEVGKEIRAQRKHAAVQPELITDNGHHHRRHRRPELGPVDARHVRCTSPRRSCSSLGASVTAATAGYSPLCEEPIAYPGTRKARPWR